MRRLRSRHRDDYDVELRGPPLVAALVLTWVACSVVVSLVAAVAAISAVVMRP